MPNNQHFLCPMSNFESHIDASSCLRVYTSFRFAFNHFGFVFDNRHLVIRRQFHVLFRVCAWLSPYPYLVQLCKSFDNTHLDPICFSQLFLLYNRKLRGFLALAIENTVRYQTSKTTELKQSIALSHHNIHIIGYTGGVVLTEAYCVVWFPPRPIGLHV